MKYEQYFVKYDNYIQYIRSGIIKYRSMAVWYIRYVKYESLK